MGKLQFASNLNVPVKLFSYKQDNSHNYHKYRQFSAIYQALSSLDRKIPTRILRHIKEQLYEIVVTNDPNDKIAILLDIDDNEQLKNAKYVVGFGEISSVGQIGYDAVKNKHLFRDLIFNDLSCDPLKVVKTAIPRLLSGNRKYIPIFKYLRKVNVLTQDGYLHRMR